jgi:hypothetical protein
MFHLTHHRPTTVQVAEMARPAKYVVFADLAPAPVPVPVPQPQPVTPSAAAWSHVRQLAAANDAALQPMDQREDHWYSAMLLRLDAMRKKVASIRVSFKSLEVYLSRTAADIRVWQGQTRSASLLAAYDQGGTAQMAGLAAQVQQMILSQALAGSAVTA